MITANAISVAVIVIAVHLVVFLIWHETTVIEDDDD